LGAVLGPDAHHQGDLSFEGRVRVDGQFTGRLYGEDALEIGASGVVDGEIDVAEAIVAGTVRGSLRVRGLLVIEASAAVDGLIDAGLLEVRPGARLRGELRVRGEALA
jgi:cytoskeletal protein CcmA (bactofilin family)